MLAPILSFTADEAWEFAPATVEESVHAELWTPTALAVTDNEVGRWISHFRLREAVLAELEKQRQAKTIGKSLEAKVILNALSPGSLQPEISVAGNHLDDVKELLNVSQLEVKRGEAVVAGSVQIVVVHADGQKCERCWHWETDVGSHSTHPTICGRCVKAVEANVAVHHPA
jgi:isoleucyl-tRNA synthetase